MRTLELNKTSLWIVDYLGMEKVYDDDGYYTGVKQKSYSEPRKIKLHLYPATGDILERTFGKQIDCDMVTSTTEKLLDVESLLFIDEPTNENYDKSYDYSVSSILKSLNNYTYGLKSRV